MSIGTLTGRCWRIAPLALTFCAALGASAAEAPCTSRDAAAAQKAVDLVVTWDQLHQSWKTWSKCDSGPVGEQFTDALLRLMVDWKNVPALADAMKDPGFHDFVFAHLKSEAAKPDRSSVYSRARSNCPAGYDAFCNEIAEATK